MTAGGSATRASGPAPDSGRSKRSSTTRSPGRTVIAARRAPSRLLLEELLETWRPLRGRRPALHRVQASEVGLGGRSSRADPRDRKAQGRSPAPRSRHALHARALERRELAEHCTDFAGREGQSGRLKKQRPPGGGRWEHLTKRDLLLRGASQSSWRRSSSPPASSRPSSSSRSSSSLRASLLPPFGDGTRLGKTNADYSAQSTDATLALHGIAPGRIAIDARGSAGAARALNRAAPRPPPRRRRRARAGTRSTFFHRRCGHTLRPYTRRTSPLEVGAARDRLRRRGSTRAGFSSVDEVRNRGAEEIADLVPQLARVGVARRRTRSPTTDSGHPSQRSPRTRPGNARRRRRAELLAHALGDLLPRGVRLEAAALTAAAQARCAAAREGASSRAPAHPRARARRRGAGPRG